MRALIFIILFLAVLYAIWYNSKPKEGFQASAEAPVVNIPPAQPEVKALLGSGGPVAFTPPTTALLAPPPGQMASVNTFAYEDPSLEKAPLRRIQEVQANLKGFFANEANGLAKTSDPTVSLPLHTAKGDLQRLQDEVNVMARNPGIPSTLTQQDINEVEANLSYLQRKWRLSANNIPFSVEGFQDMTETTPVLKDAEPAPVLTTETVATKMAPSTDSNAPAPNPEKASLKDLQEASLRISTEIVRLQASGTTDPIIQARVDNFNALKKQLDDIIDKLTKGILMEAPMTKAELDALLKPVQNQELPSIIPPTLQTALSPGGDSKDSQSLMKTLLDRFLNNISVNASLNLNYMSPAEENIAKMAASALAESTAFPITTSMYEGASSTENTEYAPAMADTSYRGQLENTVQAMQTSAQAQGEEWKAKPAADGSLPTSTTSGLDWKSRVQHICQQVEKRGYNPGDFGCLGPTDVVSPNFSWRGHAKMVCSRLQTIYEPGVPEMCGCPAPTWPGWRS
jgi:hypothetical protein